MTSDSAPGDRRSILKLVAGLLAVGIGAGWFARRRAAAAADAKATAEVQERFGRLELPRARWKELLPPRAYDVLFEEATERPFSSPLNDEKRDGTFICAACFLPLFSSKAKYDSGTGWPSFYEALPGRVGTKRDFALILPRTEYHCARCDGHQGHVFDDGPPPTGLRYCNNGVALRFVPDGEALPELRQAS
jgi:peptide-methionine (R)-S-oxide reductase